jgi:hypothetical protein
MSIVLKYLLYEVRLLHTYRLDHLLFYVDCLTVSVCLFPGVEVLRAPAWKVVLQRNPRHLLAALPAAVCRHRDVPGQQKYVPLTYITLRTLHTYIPTYLHTTRALSPMG